jgi:predicted DCC family thiol-disulfide oxidoreductase YuxK
MTKLEVLYNSKCPICSREIKHYERLSSGDISFIEITAESTLEWGLSEDQATKQIHARYQGHLFVGVDAFVELWRRLPYYNKISRLFYFSPLKSLANGIYQRILAPLLFRMHKKRCARNSKPDNF